MKDVGRGAGIPGLSVHNSTASHSPNNVIMEMGVLMKAHYPETGFNSFYLEQESVGKGLDGQELS